MELLADPEHQANWGFHRSVSIWVLEFIDQTTTSIIATAELETKRAAGIETEPSPDHMARSPDPNVGSGYDE